jgi:CHAD domain
VKARRVKGLDPAGPLADQVERIVLVRLDELHRFVPAALDPAEVTALHDLRIAAKRLRYILETTAEACFGPYARTAAKRARELQDLLGEIHDCDETLPRVIALADELCDTDATVARLAAGDADDLDPALTAGTPHAEARRGLQTLAVHLQARRALLHGRFLEEWRRLEREGFRARLEYAVTERPPGPAGDRPAGPDLAAAADAVASAAGARSHGVHAGSDGGPVPSGPS